MVRMGNFDAALKVAEKIKNKRYRSSAFKEIALEMASMGNFDAALKVAEKIKNKRYRSSAYATDLLRSRR